MRDNGREVGVGLAFCETTLGRVEKVLDKTPVSVAAVTVQGVPEAEVFATLCAEATFCTDDCVDVVDVELASLREKTDVCAGKSLAVVIDCTS